MMMKLILLFITIIATSTAYGQQNTDYNDLSLNGLASYEQLRKEYFIAALYLESFTQDSDSIMNYSGMKRMELRIVIDEWSPRRFAQHWNQAMLINNKSDAQEKFSEQILAFTNIPKESLISGDIITIDLHPDSGTTVSIDGIKIYNTSSVDFFDVLLNTWIGARPPSSDFKRDILTLPTDAAGTELLTRYEALGPDNSRKKQVAGWVKSSPAKEKAAVAAVAATTAKVASSASAGSMSTTTVTASGSSSPTKPQVPGKTSQAPTRATTKAEAPKPNINVAVEKPKLVAPAPAAPPKTEPQTTPVKTVAKAPAAATKTQPTAPAKKAVPVATASTQEQEQENLLRVYRSNVLKLTYLNTQYPKRSMDLKQQGLVVLKIKLNRQGKVLSVEEEQATNYALLNKAARKAINKSEPYPEVPTSMQGNDFEISLPFNFKL